MNELGCDYACNIFHILCMLSYNGERVCRKKGHN